MANSDDVTLNYSSAFPILVLNKKLANKLIKKSQSANQSSHKKVNNAFRRTRSCDNLYSFF